MQTTEASVVPAADYGFMLSNSLLSAMGPPYANSYEASNIIGKSPSYTPPHLIYTKNMNIGFPIFAVGNGFRSHYNNWCRKSC